MPHCIVEYSANLRPEGRIDILLAAIAAHFRTAPEVFPEAGVRVRAWPVQDYLIADGQPGHAFVNVTCRIGAGRDRAFLAAFFGTAFAIVKDHFAELSTRRGIGITFYVDVADPDLSWKTNSVRAFMAAP
jgi:5-carboxymethyl-2-hydroxymuconate isomerase